MQRRHLGAVLLLLLAILLVGTFTPAVARAATAAQKRAQAKAIKTQIDALDVRLEMAVEQYNLASDKLAEVQARVVDNKRRLEIAGDNLTFSRETLALRAVAIYKQGTVDLLDVVLATSSFDELVSSLDLMQRLSQNDSTIVDSVEKLKKEIKQRRVALLTDQNKAQQIVSQRAAMRQQVEGSLAERQTMLKGVKKEIAKLEKQEAERARLAALAAQQYAASPSVGASAGEGAHTTLGAHPSVVDVAKAQLGDPYVWAAAGPDSFDCSGLAMYCYSVATGIALPHNAAMQYAAITHIARDSAQPGDLVFFGYSAGSIHHVGIYIGNGQMIHAPHTGDVVSYESVDYSGDLYGFGRP
jgi:peptidoglycan DL-endopeptidase CwlO